jgi:hypothetical protein
MNAKASVPRGINDIVARIGTGQMDGTRTDREIRNGLKTVLVACAVKTDVSAVELGTDILELAVESLGALAWKQDGRER